MTDLRAPKKNCVKNLNEVEDKKKNMSEPRIKNNINRSGASLFFFPKRSEDLAIIFQCMFFCSFSCAKKRRTI
jgi:hypothetical protein